MDEVEAGPSKHMSDSDPEEVEDETNLAQLDGLADGMDPEGFSGPPKKIVKPLTKEALAEFQAIQDRAGVIYISRIPPGMRPTKVRHLMTAYGEIGRVYLQQEGMLQMSFFTCCLTSDIGIRRRKARISTTQIYIYEKSSLHRGVG
jgi:ESF2/ABP1 family protein